MKYLKQIYHDAGGFIAALPLFFFALACIGTLVNGDDLIINMLIIGIFLLAVGDFHHAALRFRYGREIGKIEGLKRAMDIARGVKND